MNRKIVKRIVLILSIIMVSNYCSSFINVLTEGLFKTYYYESESGRFQFTAMPSKGRDTNVMKRQYDKFIEKNNIKKEKIYRTFKMDFFKFWNWYNYLTSDPYKFPYRKRIIPKEKRKML
ncbi:hypothetical protein ACWGOQ_0002505 [Aquimarina sp. M1]